MELPVLENELDLLNSSRKGTFAGRIKHIYPDIVHISTGDILRENVKNQTELGKKAKAFMDKGELVPDDIVIGMVKDRLNREDVKKEGMILDGFPRTLHQAKELDKTTKIDKLILCLVEEEIIIKRILGRYACKSCGYTYNKYFLTPKKEGVCDHCGAELKFEQRTDDTEEAIKTRLKTYEANAKPVIDFYEKKEIVVRVDTENTLEYSREEIENFIK